MKEKDDNLHLTAYNKLIDLYQKIEEMAYILWDQAESIGARKWWRQEWEAARSALDKAGIATESRPDIESGG